MEPGKWGDGVTGKWSIGAPFSPILHSLSSLFPLLGLSPVALGGQYAASKNGEAPDTARARIVVGWACEGDSKKPSAGSTRGEDTPDCGRLGPGGAALALRSRIPGGRQYLAAGAPFLAGNSRSIAHRKPADFPFLARAIRPYPPANPGGAFWAAFRRDETFHSLVEYSTPLGHRYLGAILAFQLVNSALGVPVEQSPRFLLRWAYGTSMVAC